MDKRQALADVQGWRDGLAENYQQDYDQELTWETARTMAREAIVGLVTDNGVRVTVDTGWLPESVLVLSAGEVIRAVEAKDDECPSCREMMVAHKRCGKLQCPLCLSECQTCGPDRSGDGPLYLHEHRD